MSAPWQEETLLALSAAYERETRFADSIPPVAG
jgi:Asp-tRNA(Asn)/Glu-tRNA(Gln) amidotransferase A subunit family amidase